MSVKLSDATARTLALVLVAVHEGLRESNQDFESVLVDMREASQDDGWRRENHRETLRGMAALLFDFWPSDQWQSIDAMRRELVSSLGLYDRERNEGPQETPNVSATLVDIVVEAIQDPLAGSMLRGATLDRLRQALLDPEELSKLQTSQARMLYCSGCNQPFAHRERITVADAGPDRIQLWCSRCINPMQVRCHHQDCENLVITDEERRFWCPAHQPEGITRIEEAPWEPQVINEVFGRPLRPARHRR